MKLILFALSFLVWSCNPKSKFSENEKPQARLLLKVIDLDNQSNDISNSGAAFSHVRQEDIRKMLELKRAALSTAEQIPMAVLKKIHKELPEHFSKYKKSLRLRIKNLEVGDAYAEIEGGLLQKEWSDWFNNHSKEMRVPKE